ncbi:hypothetical protein NDU88_003666 [Pleurodeles waltl]|uniref:Uncharacterized protein n=1 Tax=Pleurodeles waltl TaxID=8319 RepID=A0AAV7VDY5_PLEWA|nr:hypothetical protein NDU88_003666 [Pleurodeles waltl]
MPRNASRRYWRHPLSLLGPLDSVGVREPFRVGLRTQTPKWRESTPVRSRQQDPVGVQRRKGADGEPHLKQEKHVTLRREQGMKTSLMCRCRFQMTYM